MKTKEKKQLIASIIFWLVILAVAIYEYKTICFGFSSPIMIIIWGVSIVTAMQYILCIGQPTGAKKVRKSKYNPVNYDSEALNTDIKKQNKSAFRIIIIWVVFLLTEGIFIHCGIVKESFIIVGMIILRIVDRAFVLIWCPFGAIMGNKCCNTCRIYGWDQLMLCSPMIFYPSAYTITLLVISSIPFIEWEITIKTHPERFSELSNRAIRCSKNCKTWCGRCKFKNNKESWFSRLLFFYRKNY